MSMSYILVTPAKNEGKNLPKLIHTIIKQIRKPIIWIIVDDGSTDETFEIIKRAQSEYSWMQALKMLNHPRDLGKHYAIVCNEGFKAAIGHCKDHNIDYEYIGLLDADMTFDEDFFEKLIGEFKINPRLGVASGSLSNFKAFLGFERDDLPYGSPRLWRRKCFEETGGFPLGYAADSQSNTLAKLRGWETKRFTNLKVIQSRLTGSAEGLWNGYKNHGISAYCRDYQIIFILLRGIYYSFQKPFYLGIAFVYGYVTAAILKMEKIDNRELRNYYRKQKHSEAISFYINKLNSILKL